MPGILSRSILELRRYVTAVLAREVLRDVAALLDARGIPVMPLKGVLFQLLPYAADPARRPLTDIDVLVPERAFGAAIEALLEAGFVPQGAGRSLIEVALRSPRGMTLDLHRRLFGLGRYKLATEELFRRASTDERLLGAPLRIAHPHDTAAHLIGKFVSDHECEDTLPRLRELLDWVAYCRIEPRHLGPHLRAVGLSRAARYVFRRGAELTGAPFFAAALAALPGDPLGELWERAARAMMPELSQSALGSLPAHLLNASLARGGASLLLSAAQRCRHRWLEQTGGGRGGHWSPFFAERSAHHVARSSAP